MPGLQTASSGYQFNVCYWLIPLMLWPSIASAQMTVDFGEVLVVRYASLVGGREPGSAPTSAGVLSKEELIELLIEWQPETDNDEVRDLFALNEIGELARQASQLPVSGGSVSGVYIHGGASYEIDLNIQPAASTYEGKEVFSVAAEISLNGELISGPRIQTPLGTRAIISTATGPGAPFLFLVVEVDRVSKQELQKRGMRHVWRTDYHLADGDNVTAPVAIEKTPPVYTQEAKAAKHRGRVVLRTVIDALGVVEDVEVVEAQPYGLTEAAIEAVRGWRFEPGRLDGEPVAVFYMLTVNFDLKE
ncbi:MAG: energy transducer TonB [Acidobacteriota bacterium]